MSLGEEKVRGRTSKAGKRGSADPSEPLVPTVILWGTVWILKEKILKIPIASEHGLVLSTFPGTSSGKRIPRFL